MEHIYQLKIELKGSNPKIWRRIQIAEDTPFSELHDIIQLSMGWQNEHLYEFIVNGTRIHDFDGELDDGSDPSEMDSMDIFLNEMVSIIKTKFTYIYDFGDHWEHTILVEKILPAVKDNTYPICISGKRACPPEDCGGIWGYQELLNTLSDKNHPQHEETISWLGGEWDAEYFDCEQVNVLLTNYAEEWEQIYKETGGIFDDLEEKYVDDDDWDDVEDISDEDYENEYDEAKKFAHPNDMLLDDYERSEIEDWVDSGLDEDDSVEVQTLERLSQLGYDKNEARKLLIEAFTIEKFYDFKYGTDYLNDRYEYNLSKLPEPPQEIPRLQDALDVLNLCIKGVPFSAIEYLQNNSSKEATTAIVNALKNYSDHQYCWEDCVYTPFWYALAAEGHLCEKLIEPVIRIYEENINESDWLHDQGQYLIGKLAEKYPDLTANMVLDAMDKEVDNPSNNKVYYLLDALQFINVDKYKIRLLSHLKKEHLSWYYLLAGSVAKMQLKEAIPILKEKLIKIKANPSETDEFFNTAEDIEEAINVLEGNAELEPEDFMPLSLRRNSWQEYLIKNESSFYDFSDEEEDFKFPASFEKEFQEMLNWPALDPIKPITKEKRPGRNDPCHCGSGKKYKKCCMDKDSKNS